MDYTTLGRTGLRVSVAGLGCGGFSRLGLGTGKSPANAEAIVHQALAVGVNLFDTAAAYGKGRWTGEQNRQVGPDHVSYPGIRRARSQCAMPQTSTPTRAT